MNKAEEDQHTVNSQLRLDLQAFLEGAFPGAEIESEHTVVDSIHIRFELGGELENGTTERVNQSVARALALFNDTFPDADNKLWLLVYEWPGEDIMFGAGNDYLLTQFPTEISDLFYNQTETINTGYTTTDDGGNEVPEQQTVTLIIGRVTHADMNIESILTGIANKEMGLEPSIDQRVYFLDPATDRGFMMYDDRGCYVWSNEPDKIRYLYEKYNGWIVEYHRKEIDAIFA